MINGYITLSAAVPQVKVGDIEFNKQHILQVINRAADDGAEIVVLPELCITGYSMQDLFRQQLLLDRAEAALGEIAASTAATAIIAIVGLPVRISGLLYNCAALCQRGKILGVVAKTYLPDYGEFYERRWFTSADRLADQSVELCGQTVAVTSRPQIFRTSDGVTFGIELCEDVWAPMPPSTSLALCGAEVMFNLSASDANVGKHGYLKSLLANQSARLLSAYVYASAGVGESTTDVVYDGNAMIFENGRLLTESPRFQLGDNVATYQVDISLIRAERLRNTTFAVRRGGDCVYRDALPAAPMDESRWRLTRDINPTPFLPAVEDRGQTYNEILDIQAHGLARRLRHTGCRRAVIGISGGLDSTLALIVACRAFDIQGLPHSGILGVTMPGMGTSSRTHDNALSLMRHLGVEVREISIAPAVRQHFADIGQDPETHDITYENSQARERTQLLMDLANKEGGLVIGTGDMSELALGWATYAGDHISMYGVNAGVPKTLITYLVRHAAAEMPAEARDCALDIIATPISPELIPADAQDRITQKTEDLVGPYVLHDFFLYHCLRYGYEPRRIYLMAVKAFSTTKPAYSPEVILKWLGVFYRRFFAQQFKRSCLPDGPKVGSVALSPRGDWRMPSDAVSRLWINQVEELRP